MWRWVGLPLCALWMSAASPLRAANTLLPAPSTWTLNAAKSDFGGVPGMKSDVWRILVDNEHRFKYTDVMVLDSGQRVPNDYDGPHDGTLHPTPGWPGTQVGYNLADDSMHAKLPDGTRMDGVMSLSDGGKVMTVRMEMLLKDGHTVHQRLVYERTK